MIPRSLTVSGVKLLVDQDRICDSVLSGKPFEPDSLRCWSELCGPLTRCLDIGAYTGIYSIKAALRGSHVTAFEPLAANRERFRANARANGVKCRVNSEVVTDFVGETFITVNPTVVGLTSGASLMRRNGKQVAVNALTIDSLNLPALHLIKIDVERAEPQVIRGAMETLKRLRPIILLEVLDRQRQVEVLELLTPLRYVREAELDSRNWLMRPR